MSRDIEDELDEARADYRLLRARLDEAEKRAQAKAEALRIVYHRWARGDLTDRQAVLLFGQHVGIDVYSAPDWKRPPDPCPDLGLPHALKRE